MREEELEDEDEEELTLISRLVDLKAILLLSFSVDGIADLVEPIVAAVVVLEDDPPLAAPPPSVTATAAAAGGSGFLRIEVMSSDGDGN